ncbi:MAG: hypothetical protein ACLR5H_12985 [Oscillospiraceae bacterium]
MFADSVSGVSGEVRFAHPLSLTVFLLLWTLPVLLMSDWTGRY